MKIEMGKLYKTRNGGKKMLRVLCVDAPGKYPVVVLWEDSCVDTYTQDGRIIARSEPSPDDLVAEVNEWDDFKIDEPVLVSDDGKYWRKRYFAGVDKSGNPLAYVDGATSWTSGGSIYFWFYARRPTQEEMAGHHDRSTSN